MFLETFEAFSATYHITNDDDSDEMGTGMKKFEKKTFPEASLKLQATGVPSKNKQISTETPSPLEDMAVALTTPGK